MKNLSILLCAAVLVFGVVGISHAELHDRGGGLIYCDTLDITLLQDAHANGAGVGMKWNDAMAWTEGLQYYDSVRDATWDDWRLPDPRNQDGSGPFIGYNFTDTEMGHIYYTELGNAPFSGGFSNSGPFENIQTVLTYWMNMERVENPGFAYRFDFSSGNMSYGNEENEFYVWAVRDGDVGVPPPVASAGPDQIVFYEVTLDGSQSYDPNGLIESYQWYLQYREDSLYDLTAEGISPTIPNLEPGFYEVTLTVTNNDGLTGTDTMLLAVADDPEPQPNADLSLSRFQIRRIKGWWGSRSSIIMSGGINLPDFDCGDSVESRITIELFDAHANGGDVVIRDEATFRVQERPYLLTIMK